MVKMSVYGETRGSIVVLHDSKAKTLHMLCISLNLKQPQDPRMTRGNNPLLCSPIALAAFGICTSIFLADCSRLAAIRDAERCLLGSHKTSVIYISLTD